MAKTVGKLTNEGDYDFIVIGLVCQNRDYRLCHELNKVLNIELEKKAIMKLQAFHSLLIFHRQKNFVGFLKVELLN